MKFKFNILFDINYDLNVGKGISDFIIFSLSNMGVFAVQCGAVLGHFQHHTLRCGLAKIITAPQLILVVTCAVRCGAVQVWCGLEFSQNHDRTAPHFCGHMCDTMYKIRFVVSIFFKLWDFLTQPKTNFSLFFGSSFKLLS